MARATADSIESMDADLGTPLFAGEDIDLDLGVFNRSPDHILCESALAQWLLTKWVLAERCNAHFALATPGISADTTTCLVQSHPGRLLALLPLGRIKGVRRRESALLRDKLLRSQDHWPGLAIDPAMALYCVDSHPIGLPKQLYPDGPGALTDWDGFRVVLRGLISTLGNARSPAGQLAARMDAVSTILFELFKNTHDHARTNAEHEIIGHSVRALYARYYTAEVLRGSLPGTSEEVLAAGLNPAESYTWSILQPQAQRRGAGDVVDGMLELSVFDSGPGLAARWYGKATTALSVREELQFVLCCLTKGQTTSHSVARGFGLWNVLQQLRTLRGFFRIRTNRVHAYRDFDSKKDAALKTEGELRGTPREILFDWQRQLLTDPSEYSNVAGTLISVLLPLRLT